MFSKNKKHDQNEYYQSKPDEFKLKQIQINEIDMYKIKQKQPSRKRGLSQSIIQGKQNKHNPPPYSYSSFSKTLQSKSALISNQQQQIMQLKQCLQDIQANKRIIKEETQIARQQELMRLRKCEQEYTTNLKELQELKQGITRFKLNYQEMKSNLQHQKQVIKERYQKTLQENEEMTICIASLKEELQKRGSQEAKYKELENQFQMHREVHRNCRDIEMQKMSLEERCTNFQRKVNQYVLKYNQMQGQFNQTQIKYFRLQKECDGLKIQKEECQIKCNQLNKVIQNQRDQANKNQQHYKSKNKQLQRELQQKNEQIQRLKREANQPKINEEEQILICQMRRLKDDQIKIKQEHTLEIKKWQKYVKQIIKQYKSQVQQLQNTLKLKQKQFQNLKLKLQKQKDILQDQRSKMQRNQQNLIQINEYKRLQTKTNELIIQNERIRFYCDKYEHLSKECTSLSNKCHMFQCQNDILMNNNNLYLVQIKTLKYEVDMLKSKLESMKDNHLRLEERAKQAEAEKSTIQGMFIELSKAELKLREQYERVNFTLMREVNQRHREATFR